MQRKSLNDPRLLLDLTRQLRQERPQVVHTHLFYADVFGRTAARLARVPVIVSTEHSTEAGRLSLKRRAGMWCTARMAHRIVAVSDAVRDAAARHLGMDAAQIDVIPNGVDVDAVAQARALSRQDLGIRADAILLGCVGRLVPSKGYAALLQALAKLEDVEAHLLMVGDGPERQALETQTRELGIANRVTWLGFRDDVPRLLKSLDVFVMPSYWEGHSIALLEAMAAACACVVSDIPELTGTLGAAGERVVAGDPESIRARLHALARDPERRVALGTAANQQAKRFSIHTAAERYMNVYAQLLNRGARSLGERSA